MLSLDSPHWARLTHAYGSAGNIPELLRLLGDTRDSAVEADAWHALWSALAHQGDVYDASFAAVPHVVHILGGRAADATFEYFQFPAWVEICRAKKGVEVPLELAPAYRTALDQIPSLVARAATRSWDPDFLACCIAAVAASKGSPVVAEAALELQPDVAQQFLDWFFPQ